MKKILVVIALSLGVVGCGPTYSETTGKYILPKELAHCSVFSLRGEGLTGTATVVKCPYAQVTTTSSCGKNCTNNVTVD